MIMQVEHLTKSFGGRTLFSDACFRLEAHDRLALVGPNGAGKTTMLKIITGHEDADSGNVVFAKGAVVAGVAGVAASLAGAGRAQADEWAGYTPGTYTAQVMGHNAPFTVTCTFTQ